MEIDKNLKADHLLTVIDAEYTKNGPAGHHINSYTRLMGREGIKSIITKQFKIAHDNMPNKRDITDEDKEIKTISYKATFLDIDISKPVKKAYASGRREPMYPQDARTNNMTYKAVIHGRVLFEATALLRNGTTRQIAPQELTDVELGAIPVVIKSNICHLNGATRHEAIALGEDPDDPGGYMIIGGLEKALVSLESNSMNNFQIYKGKKKEIIRGEFMSKPGDAFENSYQLKISFETTGHIYIDLVFSRDKPLRIPFYLLFRLFGVVSDRRIFQIICYDLDSNDSTIQTMIKRLEKATLISYAEVDPIYNELKNTLDVLQIAKLIFGKISKLQIKENANTRKFMYTEVMRRMDEKVLPHMGTNPESRYKKVLFLGHLINELFQAEFGGVPLTDRDTYASKAGKLIFDAGASLARAIKTNINFTIIQPAIIAFDKAFANNPFSLVQMKSVFKASIKASELENNLIKSIKSGLKTINIGSLRTKNRISSNNLERGKNGLNVIATLRGISTSSGVTSKTSDRSRKIRAVHPSFIGYIDPNHTVEGTEAGLMKQMTKAASITESTSSAMLKKVILEDAKLTPLNDIILADVHTLMLSKIFINGEWIGCTDEPFEFVNHYRMERRKGKIHNKTTIYLDQTTLHVYFLTTRGILTRPLMIVENNGKEGPGFKQWIRMTKKHCIGLLNKQITMDDLVLDQIVEYISISEQENCLVCLSIGDLRREVGNYLRQYTHCDIEQAMYGDPILSSPFMTGEPSNRASFQSKQVRQSASWYAMNWYNRFDKNASMQLDIQMPISRTIANKYYIPIGYNAIVALMCFDGQNQEDSMNINKASSDRGLFACAYNSYYATTLETDEVFKNPDINNTKGIKQGSYNNLVDGFIREGTEIHHGDVLIGKVYCPPSRKAGVMCQDRSVIYTKEETAIVDKVCDGRNEKDARFCKVRTSSYRDLTNGDKLSSRSSNKSIVSEKKSEADMPFCEDGTPVDFIINPHAAPTRMVVNQICLESMTNLLWLKRGIIGDATAHRDIDIHRIIDELKKENINWKGIKTMYNGETGERINVGIFVVPMYYQRNKKFIRDENGVGTKGRVNPRTDQPVGGIHKNGALKVGEMENQCFNAYGASHMLAEKFYDDSDTKILPVCKTCGHWAVQNKEKNVYYCKNCRQDGYVVDYRSCTTSKLMLDQINGSGIDTKLFVDDLEVVEYLPS